MTPAFSGGRVGVQHVQSAKLMITISIKLDYFRLPSIRPAPECGHLKQKLNF